MVKQTDSPHRVGRTGDAPVATKSPVRQITVNEGQVGQRIDNFLLNILKGVPRTYIYRILRKGEARVNKGRIKPTYRLENGDVVRVPPVRCTDPDTGKGKPGERMMATVRDSIIYEDDDLLALNKPSGIAVHGGSGVTHGAIETIRCLYPNAPYLELVHRLDRATSGCLLIAKNRVMLLRLHELLQRGAIDKHYQALVKGEWRGELCSEALTRNVQQSGERMVTVSTNGKSAQTRFTPQRCFRDTTLMDVELYTGRTHQIRVHAAHAGHPLAGDDKYGDDAFNRRMRHDGLKRLFLHADSIAFKITETGRKYRIETPLSAELEAIVAKLQPRQQK
ncbi:MAG: RluA family pseudouridine synthase [Gammaproteobacteria bacterium]|nr:RluA family pseudouridine synthase [Gammaproteobacteria bacterium]